MLHAQMAMRLLIEMALTHEGTQFIVLTPLAVDAIRSAEQLVRASDKGRAMPRGFVAIRGMPRIRRT